MVIVPVVFEQYAGAVSVTTVGNAFTVAVTAALVELTQPLVVFLASA